MVRFILAFVLTASAMASNRAVMVRDIATQHVQGSSDPRIVAAGETVVYLTAETGTAGRELWVTDGTPGGTRMVFDIAPGAASAYGLHGQTLGDRLIFAATPIDGGERQLWVTDGTAAGTRRLFDGEPINPSEFVRHNGKMFFTARKAETGYLLWVTDGTVAGTRHLATEHVGWTGKLRVFEGALYALAGFTELDGTQLYRSVDGTSVERVGPANAAHDYAIVGGRFIGANELRVFRRDSNTEAVTILHNRFAYRFFMIGSTIYFAGSDATLGMELWKTDGTPQGTMLVADVAPGAEASDPYPIAAMNGRLLFATKNGQLWSSDGTAPGTYLLRDVRGSYPYHWYSPTKLDDRLYLSVVDDDRTGTMWRTDGTPSGTEPIVAIEEDRLAAFRGALLFTADIDGTGSELFRTDGTAAPQLVADLRGSTTSSSPGSLVSAHGRVYFVANDGSGPAIWRSDGTARGTSVVVRGARSPAPIAACGEYLYYGAGSLSSLDSIGQIRPVSAASLSGAPACIGSTLLFVGAESRLHATDGRTVSQLTETSVDRVVSIGNRAVFVRDLDDTLGVTDGTVAGTRQIASFTLGGLETGSLAGADSQAYFVSGGQLWVTDGTSAGTRALATVTPTVARAVGRHLIFLAGFDLWRSDGTPEGTANVAGAPRTTDRTLTATSDTAFFVEELPNGRRRVWRTDGTAGGTYPTDATYSIFSGTMFGLGDVLFVKEGNVLTTFGARTTTIVLPEDPHIPTFVRAGDLLFFPANDGLFGEELWMADLTPRRRSARH